MQLMLIFLGLAGKSITATVMLYHESRIFSYVPLVFSDFGTVFDRTCR